MTTHSMKLNGYQRSGGFWFKIIHFGLKPVRLVRDAGGKLVNFRRGFRPDESHDRARNLPPAIAERE